MKKRGKSQMWNHRREQSVFYTKVRFVVEWGDDEKGFAMRLKHTLIIAAGFAVLAPSPSHAQNNVQYVPMYNNTATGQTAYNGQSQGGYPVYNSNNTQPLPLQQMIAGKNAPSYNFSNQPKPYNFQTGPNIYQPQPAMTPAEQQAAAYQQQLMQQQQQQQGVQQQQQYYNQQQQASNNVLNGGPFGSTPDAQVPVRRKVLYKEMNNPLKTPARLFDPEQ